MAGILVFLLLSTLAGPAASSRQGVLDVGSETQGAETDKFCTSDLAALECADEHVIVTQQAMYISQTSSTCEAGHGSEESCDKDATDAVAAECDGLRYCLLDVAFHRNCKDYPFTYLRVRWECEKGSPGLYAAAAAATTTVEGTDTPGGNDLAIVEAHTTSVATNEKVVAHIPGATAVSDKSVTDQKVIEPLTTTGEEAHNPKTVAETAPTTSKEATGQKVVEPVSTTSEASHKASSKVKEFEACYRFTRMQRLWRGEFNSYLTTCPAGKGCFKVIFPSGKIYADPEVPPSQEALHTASYSTEADSRWVTFSSVGLQRNDYSTWGVCLSKEGGVDHLIEEFNSIKKSR